MEDKGKTKKQLIDELKELRNKVLEFEKYKNKIKKTEEEIKITNQIAQIFLTVPDEDMYSEVLNIVLEALESKYGVFGYIDEKSDLIIPTMTRTVWNKCDVKKKNIIFPRNSWGNSSWPKAIREKKFNYSNKRSPLIPKGHIPIERHINMPIVHRGEVIGLLQVANKENDYIERDIHLMKKISDFIAPVLNARLQQDRMQKAQKLSLIELKAREEELQRSNKELEQFAYMASHDLQEPLRMVSSYNQLLEKRYKDQLDQDAKDFIGFAVDGANRMQRLIDDLLSYSRVNTRGQPFVAVDSQAILGDALANLQSQIEETGAVVTNDALPKIKGDESQLLRIFQNLIENALKFRGSKSPRIHISAKNQKKSWLFSIKDNGMGIDPKYKDKIFVIFQRLHSKTEYKGTGIGLTICKRIVERHGGQIWIESKLNEGSTFYFTILKRRK
jgi:signal transduction histidine kinase